MKVEIRVDRGESAADAKELRKLIQKLNFALHPIVSIRYSSEYGEAGHPPYRKITINPIYDMTSLRGTH